MIGSVSRELLLFCSVVGIVAVLQALSACSITRAKTVYQFTDRLSWIIGGTLTMGIGLWRPWFTDTWPRAFVSAVALPIIMASFVQVIVGSVLTMESQHRSEAIGRTITLIAFISLIYFSFRSCGR